MRKEYDIHKEKILLKIESMQENENKSFKSKSDINCLINKKFILNSEFDHKGAKNFLKSKKIALQKIILNEDDFINNMNEMEEGKLKTNNSLNKETNNTFNLKKVRKNDRKNKINSCNNILVINKYNINNSNIKEHKHQIKGKKTHKFYSNHELKMFTNKEIKKIKSIKKIHKTNFSHKNGVDNISFLEKNDNSIMDILSQLA